jgi:hypothetical protein
VIRPLVEGGLALGGDVFARFELSDGSTSTMPTGQGGEISVGAEARPSPGSRFGLRGTAGYKFITTPATNTNVRLSRLPIKLVATADLVSDVALGVGYVHHAAVRFHGDRDLGIPGVDLDASPGVMAEVSWRAISLSYTLQTYTDEFGETYNANHVGATARWILGAR